MEIDLKKFSDTVFKKQHITTSGIANPKSFARAAKALGIAHQTYMNILKHKKCSIEIFERICEQLKLEKSDYLK